MLLAVDLAYFFEAASQTSRSYETSFHSILSALQKTLINYVFDTVRKPHDDDAQAQISHGLYVFSSHHPHRGDEYFSNLSADPSSLKKKLKDIFKHCIEECLSEDRDHSQSSDLSAKNRDMRGDRSRRVYHILLHLKQLIQDSDYSNALKSDQTLVLISPLPSDQYQIHNNHTELNPSSLRISHDGNICFHWCDIFYHGLNTSSLSSSEVLQYVAASTNYDVANSFCSLLKRSGWLIRKIKRPKLIHNKISRESEHLVDTNEDIAKRRLPDLLLKPDLTENNSNAPKSQNLVQQTIEINISSTKIQNVAHDVTESTYNDLDLLRDDSKAPNSENLVKSSSIKVQMGNQKTTENASDKLDILDTTKVETKRFKILDEQPLLINSGSIAVQNSGHEKNDDDKELDVLATNLENPKSQLLSEQLREMNSGKVVRSRYYKWAQNTHKIVPQILDCLAQDNSQTRILLLSDENLAVLYKRILKIPHKNQEKKFFQDLANEFFPAMCQTCSTDEVLEFFDQNRLDSAEYNKHIIQASEALAKEGTADSREYFDQVLFKGKLLIVLNIERELFKITSQPKKSRRAIIKLATYMDRECGFREMTTTMETFVKDVLLRCYARKPLAFNLIEEVLEDHLPEGYHARLNEFRLNAFGEQKNPPIKPSGSYGSLKEISGGNVLSSNVKAEMLVRSRYTCIDDQTSQTSVPRRVSSHRFYSTRNDNDNQSSLHKTSLKQNSLSRSQKVGFYSSNRANIINISEQNLRQIPPKRVSRGLSMLNYVKENRRATEEKNLTLKSVKSNIRKASKDARKIYSSKKANEDEFFVPNTPENSIFREDLRKSISSPICLSPIVKNKEYRQQSAKEVNRPDLKQISVIVEGKELVKGDNPNNEVCNDRITATLNRLKRKPTFWNLEIQKEKASLYYSEEKIRSVECNEHIISQPAAKCHGLAGLLLKNEVEDAKLETETTRSGDDDTRGTLTKVAGPPEKTFHANNQQREELIHQTSHDPHLLKWTRDFATEIQANQENMKIAPIEKESRSIEKASSVDRQDVSENNSPFSVGLGDSEDDHLYVSKATHETPQSTDLRMSRDQDLYKEKSSKEKSETEGKKSSKEKSETEGKYAEISRDGSEQKESMSVPSFEINENAKKAAETCVRPENKKDEQKCSIINPPLCREKDLFEEKSFEENDGAEGNNNGSSVDNNDHQESTAEPSVNTYEETKKSFTTCVKDGANELQYDKNEGKEELHLTLHPCVDIAEEVKNDDQEGKCEEKGKAEAVQNHDIPLSSAVNKQNEVDNDNKDMRGSSVKRTSECSISASDAQQAKRRKISFENDIQVNAMIVDTHVTCKSWQKDLAPKIEIDGIGIDIEANKHANFCGGFRINAINTWSPHLGDSLDLDPKLPAAIYVKWPNIGWFHASCEQRKYRKKRTDPPGLPYTLKYVNAYENLYERVFYRENQILYDKDGKIVEYSIHKPTIDDSLPDMIWVHREGSGWWPAQVHKSKRRCKDKIKGKKFKLVYAMEYSDEDVQYVFYGDCGILRTPEGDVVKFSASIKSRNDDVSSCANVVETRSGENEMQDDDLVTTESTKRTPKGDVVKFSTSVKPRNDDVSSRSNDLESCSKENEMQDDDLITTESTKRTPEGDVVKFFTSIKSTNDDVSSCAYDDKSRSGENKMQNDDLITTESTKKLPQGIPNVGSSFAAPNKVDSMKEYVMTGNLNAKERLPDEIWVLWAGTEWWRARVYMSKRNRKDKVNGKKFKLVYEKEDSNEDIEYVFYGDDGILRTPEGDVIEFKEARNDDVSFGPNGVEPHVGENRMQDDDLITTESTKKLSQSIPNVGSSLAAPNKVSSVTLQDDDDAKVRLPDEMWVHREGSGWWRARVQISKRNHKDNVNGKKFKLVYVTEDLDEDIEYVFYGDDGILRTPEGDVVQFSLSIADLFSSNESVSSHDGEIEAHGGECKVEDDDFVKTESTKNPSPDMPNVGSSLLLLGKVDSVNVEDDGGALRKQPPLSQHIEESPINDSPKAKDLFSRDDEPIPLLEEVLGPKKHVISETKSSGIQRQQSEHNDSVRFNLNDQDLMTQIEKEEKGHEFGDSTELSQEDADTKDSNNCLKNTDTGSTSADLKEADLDSGSDLSGFRGPLATKSNCKDQVMTNETEKQQILPECDLNQQDGDTRDSNCSFKSIRSSLFDRSNVDSDLSTLSLLKDLSPLKDGILKFFY